VIGVYDELVFERRQLALARERAPRGARACAGAARGEPAEDRDEDLERDQRTRGA
jgi:hypothetical protein